MKSVAHRPDPAGMRPGQLALLTAWFSLAAASAELLVRVFQKVALGQIVRLSRDAIWLAPTGQSILFGSASILLLGLGLGLRRVRSTQSVVLVFTFIATLGILVIPTLNGFAAALLSAGIAWQVSLRAANHEQGWFRFVRRSLPVLAGVLLLGATGAALARAGIERKAESRLARAREGAPNVILVIWDTVRAEDLSLVGYALPTSPNLERLARRGVLFERALAPAPWTLPSHATFFTGYLPHDLSADWDHPLDRTHATLAEAFRDEGYRTGGFAANLLYTDWEHGLARGFDHFEDYRVSTGQAFISTSLGRLLVTGHKPSELALPARLLGYRGFVGRVSADQIDGSFLGWLDRGEGRPVFAFLNYFDAHFPFEPPDSVSARFPPQRVKTTFLERLGRELRRKTFADMTPAELAAERSAYDASIAHLDQHLGTLIEELEKRGILDNTLIVVASDHGEEFREHGALGHGGNLYLTQLHVPLVIVQPGTVPAGFRVTHPVSLRDLPATIAELARVTRADVFPGFSLERTWRLPGQGVDTTQAVLAELSPGRDRKVRYRSVTVGRYQLIRNPDGRPELYDIVADPGQKTDLAMTLEHSFDVWRFDATMKRLFDCRGFNCCCSLKRATPIAAADPPAFAEPRRTLAPPPPARAARPAGDR